MVSRLAVLPKDIRWFLLMEQEPVDQSQLGNNCLDLFGIRESLPYYRMYRAQWRQRLSQIPPEKRTARDLANWLVINYSFGFQPDLDGLDYPVMMILLKANDNHSLEIFFSGLGSHGPKMLKQIRSPEDAQILVDRIYPRPLRPIKELLLICYAQKEVIQRLIQREPLFDYLPCLLKLCAKQRYDLCLEYCQSVHLRQYHPQVLLALQNSPGYSESKIQLITYLSR